MKKDGGGTVSKRSEEGGFCAVAMPDWELAVARAARPELAEVPIALLENGRVVATSPEAWEVGIRPGMKPRDAERRLPSVALLERDEALSRNAFAPVARAALELSPFLSLDERPGRLYFPLAPLMTFYGSLEAIAERFLATLPDSPVLQALARLSDPYRNASPIGIGAGPTQFLAYLSALRNTSAPSYHRSENTDLASCSSATSHRSLDLPSLEALLAEFGIETLVEFVEIPDPHDLDVLHLLGIHTLADFVSIEASALADRFGDWALRARELIDRDSLPTAHPPSLPRDHSVSWRFQPPAESKEQLVFVAERLGSELSASLLADGLFPRRLRIEVCEESGNVWSVGWWVDRVAASSLLAESLRSLRWHVEIVPMKSPIQELRLVPEELVEHTGLQLSLALHSSSSNDFSGGSSTGSPPRWSVRDYDLAYRAVCRVEAMLGQEVAYLVRPAVHPKSTSAPPSKPASVPSYGAHEARAAPNERSQRIPSVLPASYLPHQQAVFVSATSEWHSLLTSTASLPFGPEGRSSLDTADSPTLSTFPRSLPLAAPGQIPPPIPALVFLVELSLMGFSSASFRVERSPSRPHGYGPDGSGLDALQRPLSAGRRSPSRRTTSILPCASPLSERRRERSLLPVLVLRGPRRIDPPQSVNGLPVVSASGPWSYILEWWDRDNAVTGEFWQVVVALPSASSGGRQVYSNRFAPGDSKGPSTDLRATPESADEPSDHVALLLFRPDSGVWCVYAIYD